MTQNTTKVFKTFVVLELAIKPVYEIKLLISYK